VRGSFVKTKEPLYRFKINNIKFLLYIPQSRACVAGVKEITHNFSSNPL
jgi:hypothetical protein